LHALADEILKYRRAVKLLAKAIGWADADAPFALIAPRPPLASAAVSGPVGTARALVGRHGSMKPGG
jgi:hypothetical protein